VREDTQQELINESTDSHSNAGLRVLKAGADALRYILGEEALGGRQGRWGETVLQVGHRGQVKS
jgi:hypothetical protein